MSESIPIIELGERSADVQLADALGKGYEQYGFCGITGHGIPDAVIDDAYQAMKAFFALPSAVKAKYDQHNGGMRGYTAFGVETAKDSEHPDLKEFWQVGRELAEGHPHHSSLHANLWPAEVPDFKRRVYPLYEALDDLGKRILSALAVYLGLEADWFNDKVNEGNSILRPLHYPPIERSDTPSVRSAAHEDINLITLLVGSDEPGLEVLTRSGEWLSVTNPPGTIVVNIGDMLQRLTNHVLPSTTHRVVNAPEAYAGGSRYSTPFFLHPNPDFEIATLPGCITADNPNRYPEAILADDYLNQRLFEIGLK